MKKTKKMNRKEKFFKKNDFIWAIIIGLYIGYSSSIYCFKVLGINFTCISEVIFSFLSGFIGVLFAISIFKIIQNLFKKK